MAVCDPNLRNMVPKLGIGHESFVQFPPLVSQNDCADVDLSIHFSWEVAKGAAWEEIHKRACRVIDFPV